MDRNFLIRDFRTIPVVKKEQLIFIVIQNTFSIFLRSKANFYLLAIKNLKVFIGAFIVYFFLMENAQRNRRYDSWMKTRCEKSHSSRIKNNKVYLQITIFSLIFIVARNLNTIKFKESKEKKKGNNRWKNCGSTGSINLISILFRKRNFSIELTKLIFYVKRNTIHFVTLSAKESDARV